MEAPILFSFFNDMQLHMGVCHIRVVVFVACVGVVTGVGKFNHQPTNQPPPPTPPRRGGGGGAGVGWVGGGVGGGGG